MKRFSVLSLIFFGLSLATWPQAQGQISPSDPGKPGQYAVGHTGYLLTDANNGNRPVYFMVWYPVDPSSIGPSTPTAQYPVDPYTGSTYLPIMLSTDYEAVGYDAAYEAVPPSHRRPFPLVVFSPAHTVDSWQYLNVAPRLATHGYVVAVAEHWNDCQFPWGGCDEFITAAINRPRDMSFIITQLLDKNRTPGELLFETIDPEKIAAGGHSIGVYATYALAGGDRLVCDALGPVLFAGESLPYPSGTCVKTLPDRRVKAVVALDGISSQWLHWNELRKISVPSLIMGETYDAMTTNYPGLGDWNARPHAEIDRFDSYRVDVNGTNHGSFSVMCDALTDLVQLRSDPMGLRGVRGEQSRLCSHDFPCRHPSVCDQVHDCFSGHLFSQSGREPVR